MTSNDFSVRATRRWSACATAGTLTVALVLALLPEAWIALARERVRDALRPGQLATASIRSRVEPLYRRVQAAWFRSEQLADREFELRKANAERRRLLAALVAARATLQEEQQLARAEIATSEPLTEMSLIEARVLGTQARSFLERRGILEAGRADRVEPGSMVVDPSVESVDVGRDLNAESGDYLLAGRKIWGRIVEVGQHTATVRRVHAAGYRDLVRLSHGQDADPEWGSQGILEGNGAGLCRIRYIDTTEPVSVGDRVFAAPHQSGTDEPLVYGQVVRAERTHDSAHWEIWMEPSAGLTLPPRLAVLTVRANPRRVAQYDRSNLVAQRADDVNSESSALSP